MEIINNKHCTGCKMCGDVCPVKAISYETDLEGFWYPVIDKNKCISCGLCENKCPLAGKQYEKIKAEPIQVYASWNKDDKERRNATSGGLFSVFGEYILSKGGFIIGSSYSDDYKSAYHMAATDKNDFQKLKGSKYFQSDTAGIFRKTKECIDTGRKVLFVGTPCQVAALYGFLGERPDNLLTVDFICRGVSSPLLHKKKIEYYEKKGHSKVISYRDKYKKYAWIDFGARICFENGKEEFISRWRDEILHFFIMKNLNIRPSCYECQFKLGYNTSDITIGDFWQIDRVTEKDLRYGVSALMVNTEHGNLLINNVCDSLYLCKKPLERVMNGNPAYSAPPDCPKERKEFFEIIDKGGWEEALKKFKGFRAESEGKKRYHERRMKLRPYFQMWDDRKEIAWIKFFQYNFFCKSVIRDKWAFIIPYKGSYIEIQENAKLYIKGNVCINYTPYYPRGTHMCTLQLRRGSETHFDNRVELAHDALLSVGENAFFKSGYLMPRMGANIICKKRMIFGENVGIGRDGCVFDSDYHPMYNEKYEQINGDMETLIGDNVWFGVHTIVLKGTTIGNGAIIGTGSIVSGKIEPETIYLNKITKDNSRSIYNWEW